MVVPWFTLSPAELSFWLSFPLLPHPLCPSGLSSVCLFQITFDNLEINSTISVIRLIILHIFQSFLCSSTRSHHGGNRKHAIGYCIHGRPDSHWNRSCERDGTELNGRYTCYDRHPINAWNGGLVLQDRCESTMFHLLQSRYQLTLFLSDAMELVHNWCLWASTSNSSWLYWKHNNKFANNLISRLSFTLLADYVAWNVRRILYRRLLSCPLPRGSSSSG